MVFGRAKKHGSVEMIELGKVKSLNDLPENIRGLFTDENGVISLDESRVRTDVDVANVKRDKDKERDLGNAAKAELNKWKALGNSPEEITEKIADLESRSGNSTEQTEKIANLQRDLRKAKSDYDALKGELDTIKPDYEKIKTEIRQRQTGDALSDFVKTLKNVDANRLTRALKKDIMLGLIGLDESGEGLVCKDGTKLEDYAMDTARDFGFILTNTPGESRSGSEHISSKAKQNADHGGNPLAMESVFDDETAAVLDK